MADFDQDELNHSYSGGVDDDLSLPKATVFKMIQEYLPDDAVCAKETRELLLECCVEFIHIMASQANEICEKSSKKTIGPEHILESLRVLGFEDYIEDVRDTLAEQKEEQKSRGQKKKAASSKFGNNMTPEQLEELARQQEELFKAARAKYEQRLQEDS